MRRPSARQATVVHTAEAKFYGPLIAVNRLLKLLVGVSPTLRVKSNRMQGGNLMQHLRSRSIVLACLFAFVAIAAVFAACGDDDDNASTTPTKSTGASATAAATT